MPESSVPTMILQLILFVFPLLNAVAERDSTYWPPGKSNPNVNIKMYWHDSFNVLQDLDQFEKLYVQYHNCAFSPFGTPANDEENLDYEAYWYLGLTQSYRAQAAYSLYGILKGARDKGCQKATFINSFHTVYGAQTFVEAMQLNGYLGGNDNGGNDVFADNGFSSVCIRQVGDDDGNIDDATIPEMGATAHPNAVSYTLGCTDNNRFEISNYQGATCDKVAYTGTEQELYDENEALEDLECVLLYDDSMYYTDDDNECPYQWMDDDFWDFENNQGGFDYDEDEAGIVPELNHPLDLLKYSHSCSIESSQDGACPDPWGMVAKYWDNINRANRVVVYYHEGRSEWTHNAAWLTMMVLGSAMMFSSWFFDYRMDKKTEQVTAKSFDDSPDHAMIRCSQTANFTEGCNDVDFGVDGAMESARDFSNNLQESGNEAMGHMEASARNSAADIQMYGERAMANLEASGASLRMYGERALADLEASGDHLQSSGRAIGNQVSDVAVGLGATASAAYATLMEKLKPKKKRNMTEAEKRIEKEREIAGELGPWDYVCGDMGHITLPKEKSGTESLDTTPTEPVKTTPFSPTSKISVRSPDLRPDSTPKNPNANKVDNPSNQARSSSAPKSGTEVVDLLCASVPSEKDTHSAILPTLDRKASSSSIANEPGILKEEKQDLNTSLQQKQPGLTKAPTDSLAITNGRPANSSTAATKPTGPTPDRTLSHKMRFSDSEQQTEIERELAKVEWNSRVEDNDTKQEDMFEDEPQDSIPHPESANSDLALNGPPRGMPNRRVRSIQQAPSNASTSEGLIQGPPNEENLPVVSPATEGRQSQNIFGRMFGRRQSSR